MPNHEAKAPVSAALLHLTSTTVCNNMCSYRCERRSKQGRTPDKQMFSRALIAHMRRKKKKPHYTTLPLMSL